MRLPPLLLRLLQRMRPFLPQPLPAKAPHTLTAAAPSPTPAVEGADADAAAVGSPAFAACDSAQPRKYSVWQVNGAHSFTAVPSLPASEQSAGSGKLVCTPSTSLPAPLSLALRKDSPSLSSSLSACRLVLDAEYADSFQLRSCDHGLAAPPQQPERTGGDTPRQHGASLGFCTSSRRQRVDAVSQLQVEYTNRQSYALNGGCVHPGL